MTLRAPFIMGVLNVTPDSFYDGGRFDSASSAEAQIERLIADGSDIVDVGAESTRPSAAPIEPAEQIRRIGDTIARVVALRARASIDTTSEEVALRALDQGATMINSVSLEVAPALGRLASRYGAELVLMHSRGSMTTMRDFSQYPASGYTDVVADVRAEWLAAADRAVDAGVARDKVWFDPGLGFQKNAEQSITLVRELHRFADLGSPIAVGPSRKSFIAKIAAGPRAAEVPAEDRLGGTIAVVLASIDRGATLVRVHDPKPVRQALALRAAIGPSSVSGMGPAPSPTLRGQLVVADEAASSTGARNRGVA